AALWTCCSAISQGSCGGMGVPECVRGPGGASSPEPEKSAAQGPSGGAADRTGRSEEQAEELTASSPGSIARRGRSGSRRRHSSEGGVTMAGLDVLVREDKQ